MVTCEKFRIKQGIHNILRAIDCTHIRISKPINNARNFCNRHKCFSINLQAVVDAEICALLIYIIYILR